MTDQFRTATSTMLRSVAAPLSVVCMLGGPIPVQAWTLAATDSLTFSDDIFAATSANWGSCAKSAATICTPKPSASLTYSVFYELGTYNGGEAYKWKYVYDWFGYTKDLSHLIIEVSPGLTAADILAATDSNDGGLGTYGPTTNGGSNPGIPSDMYGYKWNTPEGEDATSYKVFIESWRAPMWGDFYAVDGKKKGKDGAPDEIVYAYNLGFGSTSDLDPFLDVNELLKGSVDLVANHIMRPDSIVYDGGGDPGGNGNVPEPMSLALMGIGLAGISFLRRRQAR